MISFVWFRRLRKKRVQRMLHLNLMSRVQPYLDQEVTLQGEG